MPQLIDNEQVLQIPGSTFEFSAVKPEHLESTEYTLVTVVVDRSGSIAGFNKDLDDMLQEIIKACHKNPRSENLMLRVLQFDNSLDEIHGFKPLTDIDPAGYPNFVPRGSTALYDASYSAIGATVAYAKQLMDNDFDVNGAVYIITDGLDNQSSMTPSMVRDAVEKSKRTEVIESLLTILIGINTQDAQVSGMLDVFKQDADLTQYVDVGEATPAKLAKLGGFISQSISSTSQALGTKSASVPAKLTF